MPFSRFRLLLPLFIAAALIAGVAARAEEPSEYEIKSAFLFKFASFVEWPRGTFEDKNSPLVIGILGDDPFGRDFDERVRGHPVGGRAVVIRRYRNAADAAKAQILFVSASEHDHLPAILDQLKDSGTLIVGDGERFARRGGMIGFVMSGASVHFCINHEATKRAGLKVSAELLRLARIVTGGE
jgi:hypothetical protein